MQKLINIKVYTLRSVTYINLASACMILFLFLSKLKEVGIVDWELEKYFPIIGIGSFFVLMLIGRWEINRLKGYQTEAKKFFELDPYHWEMKEKIDALHKKFIEDENNTAN